MKKVNAKLSVKRETLHTLLSKSQLEVANGGSNNGCNFGFSAATICHPCID